MKITVFDFPTINAAASAVRLILNKLPDATYSTFSFGYLVILNKSNVHFYKVNPTMLGEATDADN